MIPNSIISRISPYQNEAPVNVMGIAKELGLKIYQDELPEGISGCIIRKSESNDGDGFIVVVDKDEPYVRQRFTAAHEIGHFVLHKEMIGDGLQENYLLRADKMTNRQESQANQFAADILMPFHLINKLMEEGYNTVETLAQKLEVSKIAMGIRLGHPT